MLLRISSIFLLSFWGTLLTAQNNFKGIVISTQDNQPLAGVTVSVANNPIAITDSKGAFSFSDSNTKAYLVFTYVGYKTFSGSFISDTNNIISLNKVSFGVAVTKTKSTF